MFKKIPQTIKKELTPKQKVQKLMTDIGGGWYMKNSAKGIPPLRITKLSKKAQERQGEIKKNYMKLISGGMIGDYNCIVTNLNGWILNITPKEINPILFLQKSFTLIKIIEQLIGLAIIN